MATRREQAAKMPKWARVLFEDHWRFISLRGGRGSGKTKNICRALILKSVQRPLRILCTREVQDSIKESVYEQLKIEIEELGLSDQFTVLAKEIRSNNGSLFIFKGLNEFSADGLKSLANINICWLEEAQTLGAISWKKLEPSIRAIGSQIWMSWNPELETDFIYETVVKKGLPDCASLFVNFDQNPWFPEVLHKSEQHMAANDPIMHRHVWLGQPLPAVASAIYFNEIAQMEADGRTMHMVDDPMLNTYIIMDLGFNDFTSCGIVQEAANELRIVDFVENNRVALEWFSKEFTDRGYEDAIIVMPHDGRAKSLQTGLSPAELMESYGWQVEIAANIGIEEGIRLLRETLARIWMDKTKCEKLIDHMKRYQRTKHGHPQHDDHSHACDMMRYVAVHAGKMTNNKSGWSTGQLNYRKLVTR